MEASGVGLGAGRVAVFRPVKGTGGSSQDEKSPGPRSDWEPPGFHTLGTRRGEQDRGQEAWPRVQPTLGLPGGVFGRRRLWVLALAV